MPCDWLATKDRNDDLDFDWDKLPQGTYGICECWEVNFQFCPFAFPGMCPISEVGGVAPIHKIRSRK